MSIHSRVAELLRGERHLPRTLSEREALGRLRPYGQGVIGAPANPPLNPRAPLGPENLDGARGEQELERARNITK